MHAAAPCMDAAQHEFVLCADARPGSPAARMICCSIARPGLHTSRALCGRRKARKSCATGASRYLAAHPRQSKATRGEAGSIGPRCEVPHGLPTALEADVCTRHVGPHTYTRGADGDAEISTATHFGRARGS